MVHKVANYRGWQWFNSLDSRTHLGSGHRDMLGRTIGHHENDSRLGI